GGPITQTAVLSVAGLALNPVASAANVTLTNAGNDVDTLAAFVANVSPAIAYTDANSLAIGTVAGISGVSNSRGPVTLAAGGAITDGNGTAFNVSAPSLSLTAATGIDLDILA